MRSAARPRIERAAGLIRLVHPFPSLLNGVVVAVVAVVASGEPWVAARLGFSMALLQFAIGTTNDLVDAPLDAGRKPGKPIPAGLVTPAVGRAVAAATALGGLLLAMTSGPGVLGLALVGLTIGMAYDLRLKGTAWSWIPLALGVPLVPVFGWYGATGALPPLFLALVPIAALEGAALAIANALVDVERDQDAGVGSVATLVGRRAAASVTVALQVLVGVLAVGTAAASGAPLGWVASVAVIASVLSGGSMLGMLAAIRRPAWREAAWEVQAVGAGLLAVAWLGSLGAAGTLGDAAGR